MPLKNKDVMSKNLKKFMTIRGTDRNEMARALNIPYSTVTDWINGKKYPRIDNVEKLAEFFGVSMSDLIEDFEAKQQDNATLAALVVRLRMNPELFETVKKLSNLDKDQLESLNNLLDTFI